MRRYYELRGLGIKYSPIRDEFLINNSTVISTRPLFILPFASSLHILTIWLSFPSILPTLSIRISVFSVLGRVLVAKRRSFAIDSRILWRTQMSLFKRSPNKTWGWRPTEGLENCLGLHLDISSFTLLTLDLCGSIHANSQIRARGVVQKNSNFYPLKGYSWIRKPQILKPVWVLV